MKPWSFKKIDFNNLPDFFKIRKIVATVTMIPETLVYLPVNPGKISIIQMFHAYMIEE